MPSSAELDRDVRLHVYRFFVEHGAPPDVARVAQELGLAVEEAEASFRRLEEAHVLVLAPGTANIWMVNPLSAFPTPFWVETAKGSWWANCIWDAFGIVAMLREDGAVSTSCADCGEPMEFQIEGGGLAPVEGVAHFAVPARRWWENIGYT